MAAPNSEKPKMRIQFAQREYLTGDQVSGEIYLFLPVSVSGIYGIEVHAWGEEKGQWNEILRGTQPKIKHIKPYKDGFPEGVSYHGGRVIYEAKKMAYIPENETIAPGSYVIPFTYFLPFQTPATTYIKTTDIMLYVKHYFTATLISKSPLFGNNGMEKQATANTDVSPVVARGIPSINDLPDCITRCIEELIVIEKSTHQATVRPYSYQCAYTIPHILLGSGDLTVTMKKRITPFTAGEEIPLLLEVTNQSQTNLDALIITLRHVLSFKAYSGRYKQLSYNHSRWIRPMALRGAKKSTSLFVSVPVKLPACAPPTSHGTVISNKWEMTIACRYKGVMTFNKHVTGEDVIFPIVIWPSTIHPARRGGIICWDTVLDSSIPIDEYGDAIADDAPTPVPKPQKALLSDNVTTVVLPSIALEVSNETGVPKINTIIQLPKPIVEQPGEITIKEQVYRCTPDSIKIDWGILMSPGLIKCVTAMSGSGVGDRTKKNRQKGASVPRVKRAIAPLQK